MVNNAEGSKKSRDTLLAKNPNFYRELQAKRKTKFVPPPINSERAREISNIRWKKHREDRDKGADPSQEK